MMKGGSAMDHDKPIARTPTGMERTKERRVYVPRVDIFETKDAIVVAADMPGVDDTSVDITLENRVLTIQGTTQSRIFDGHNMVYTEYDIGDYERAFTISDEVDREKIEATVNAGVLHITLPKAEPVKMKKISVKTA